MSSFFNLLPEGSNVKLEKCGDVVVSPKDNIVALFCHFCSDIFTQLPEFARHLQCSHSDILPFSKEQNVYSVEELLSQEDEVQDDPFQSDSSSSGDSGLPTEGDDEYNKEQPQGEATVPNPCQFNANILEALAANDIDIDVPPDNLGKRDLLAEVEAMLFDDADNKADELQKENPPTKENQSETKVITESTYSRQVETSQTNSKGFRLSRSKTEQRSLSICDLKSYSITRMSRKREMKRMSSVKMRIMRSLEIEEMAAKPKRIPLTNIHSIQNKDNVKVENLLEMKPLKSELKLSPVKKINDIEAAKENRKLYTKVLPDFKTSFTKPAITSQTVSNSPKVKPSSITSTSNTKPAESFNKPFIANDPSRSTNTKISNGKLAQIDKIEILPRLNIKQEKPNSQTKVPTINSSTQLEAIQSKTSVGNESNPMPKNSQNNSTYSSSKGCTQAQLQKCKPNESKDEIKRPKMETSQSPLNFSLSDSVIEFLQSDLKSTQLNGVDSLLQLVLPSENDTLNQMETDQLDPLINTNPAPAVKANTLQTDLTLLQMIGLPIIKISTYEDKLDIDVFEGLRQKATKFSQIFYTHEKIYNRRKSGLLTHSLNQELNLFTEELNEKLRINLKVNELKRILNLINIWHTEQIEWVYFKKNRLSSDMEFYFQLFGFLPKMNRFSFYCENCEQILNLETDYKKHLQLKHQTANTDMVKCYKAKKGKTISV